MRQAALEAISDADLVHLALGGSREPVAELLRRHWDTAVLLAGRVLGSPDLARDAVQEAAVAAKTGPRAAALAKLGMRVQDTSELLFTDVRVPAANLLGEQGGGFIVVMQNLPREYVTIGVTALAMAEQADGRVQSIFGGTTEVQKEIIARRLGL